MRALRSLGFDRLRFHDTRHTHATILLKKGVAPHVVSKRLGHASVGAMRRAANRLPEHPRVRAHPEKRYYPRIVGKGVHMADLEWDESLETGDPLVDQQHRNIHSLVDYVEAARDRPEELMRVLDRLMEHVECHFATEEALMERTGYVGKDAEEHIAEHRELTEGARDTVLQFRRGELNSMEPVVAFLRTWLSDHVHERDRKFIEFVREQGGAAILPEPWASNPPTLGGWIA
jgi:hemerythrin-like metal-binding protein